MEDQKDLGVSVRARGVIPTKVSELENDLEFISREDLDKIVIANQEGEYTGITDEDQETEVVVDNLYKTIKVKLLKDIDQHLEKLLPKNGEKFTDGGYILSASVVGGIPMFNFTENTSIVPAVYYYGNTEVPFDSLSEEDIISLVNGGATKEDKECFYSTFKQYQVFAYPAKFGELSKIIHLESNLDVMNLFGLKSLTVKGLEYYAYISEASVTGKFTYKFIY